jgi:hypothetical protein
VSHRNGTLNGRVGRGGCCPVVEIDAGGAVEDHPEGVDAGAAPGIVVRLESTNFVKYSENVFRSA